MNRQQTAEALGRALEAAGLTNPRLRIRITQDGQRSAVLAALEVEVPEPPRFAHAAPPEGATEQVLRDFRRNQAEQEAALLQAWGAEQKAAQKAAQEAAKESDADLLRRAQAVIDAWRPTLGELVAGKARELGMTPLQLASARVQRAQLDGKRAPDWALETINSSGLEDLDAELG